MTDLLPNPPDYIIFKPSEIVSLAGNRVHVHCHADNTHYDLPGDFSLEDFLKLFTEENNERTT